MLHAAMIKVHEKGTEMAAATAVHMVARGIEPEKPVFRAQSPFIHVIFDRRTGLPLSMGVVNDPRKT